MTPQAPLTGSGCREHSYGGFGEDTSLPPACRLSEAQLMVFKSIRDSRLVTAATCVAGVRRWLAKQGHPAYIPRPGCHASSAASYAG